MSPAEYGDRIAIALRELPPNGKICYGSMRYSRADGDTNVYDIIEAFGMAEHWPIVQIEGLRGSSHLLS